MIVQKPTHEAEEVKVPRCECPHLPRTTSHAWTSCQVHPDEDRPAEIEIEARNTRTGEIRQIPVCAGCHQELLDAWLIAMLRGLRV